MAKAKGRGRGRVTEEPSAVRSIRLPVALWGALGREAKRCHVRPSELLKVLLGAGLSEMGTINKEKRPSL